ncbi:MAG TPA: YlxR family protein [Candidatus Onthousia faecigallinarum]|nr:YlxR family protein [Candidatus Onthousia faecigallinarum]
MKQKKIPLRTCVVSGEQFPKRDLLRIVKTKEGEIKVDETGKMNGRGAYIKKDLGILEQAKKKNSLGRKLECEIPDSIYEEIEKILKK